MSLRWQSPSSTKAFMALELLMVVSIIMVLFVLYFGGGVGGKKSRQKDFAACARNLQLIHTALLTYSSDNNDKFPFVKGAQHSEAPLSQLIPKSTSQSSAFICPSSGDAPLPEGQTFASKRISYGYVMGLTRQADPTQFILSDEQVDAKPKPTGTRVFANVDEPRGNNHGPYGGNIALLDGSVETIKGRARSDLTFTNAIYLNPKAKPKNR
jgi:hypothetical protein